MDRFEFTDYLNGFGSTAVLGAWYNSDYHNLVVQLVGGNYYGYTEVPPGTWNEFVNSSSLGSFYTREIKKHYRPFTVDYDVELVERQPAPEPEPVAVTNSTIKIRATVSGTIEYTVPQGQSREKAIEDLNLWLSKTVTDGELKIKEIVESFD